MDFAKIKKRLRNSERNGQQSKGTGQTPIHPENQDIIPEQTPAPSPPGVQGPQGKPEMPDTVPFPTDTVARPESGPVVRESTEREEKAPPTPASENRIDAEKSEEVIEILTFSLLKEEFAFEISHLQEILRSQRITKVPKVPDCVLGITSLRGKVIPVIDIKRRLALTDRPSEYDGKGKILIIKGQRGPIGITVDRVIGVMRTVKAEILPPPSHLSETELKFIDGIAVVKKRFVSLINMEEAITLNIK